MGSTKKKPPLLVCWFRINRPSAYLLFSLPFLHKHAYIARRAHQADVSSATTEKVKEEESPFWDRKMPPLLLLLLFLPTTLLLPTPISLSRAVAQSNNNRRSRPAANLDRSQITFAPRPPSFLGPSSSLSSSLHLP